MDFTHVGTVVAIVVICYLIGAAAKNMELINDKHIPTIVGVAGGILGVVGLYVIPDFPANDVLNAIAVGIESGLAAVGINQLYKQSQKTN